MKISEIAFVCLVWFKIKLSNLDLDSRRVHSIFFSLRMFAPNQGCIFCKLHSDWNRVSGKQQCCCQTVTMILINHKIEEISHATEVSVTFDEHYSKYLNIVYCTQTICLVKSYHPQQQWPSGFRNKRDCALNFLVDPNQNYG